MFLLYKISKYMQYKENTKNRVFTSGHTITSWPTFTFASKRKLAEKCDNVKFG